MRKKVCRKKNNEFQDYKNGLEETQIGRKINCLRKKRTDVDSLEEDKKKNCKK